MPNLNLPSSINLANFRFKTALYDGFTPAPQYTLLDQIAGPVNTISVSAVPLPAALPLFGTALAGLGGVGWFRKNRRKVSGFQAECAIVLPFFLATETHQALPQGRRPWTG